MSSYLWISPKYWEKFKYYLLLYHPPIFTKFCSVSQTKSLNLHSMPNSPHLKNCSRSPWRVSWCLLFWVLVPTGQLRGSLWCELCITLLLLKIFQWLPVAYRMSKFFQRLDKPSKLPGLPNQPCPQPHPHLLSSCVQLAATGRNSLSPTVS